MRWKKILAEIKVKMKYSHSFVLMTDIQGASPPFQELPGTARNWETVFADVAELDRGSPGTQPVLGGKKEIQVQGRAEGDPSETAVPTAGSQQEKPRVP